MPTLLHVFVANASATGHVWDAAVDFMVADHGLHNAQSGKKVYSHTLCRVLTSSKRLRYVMVACPTLLHAHMLRSVHCKKSLRHTACWGDQHKPLASQMRLAQVYMQDVNLRDVHHCHALAACNKSAPALCANACQGRLCSQVSRQVHIC